MAVVPGVLLDHVQQDPAQAEVTVPRAPALAMRRRSRPPSARAPSEHRSARATPSSKSARSSSGVSSAAVCHSQSWSASQSTAPRSRRRVAEQAPTLEPVVLDQGQVLEHPAERHRGRRQRLRELLLGQPLGLPAQRVAVVVEEGDESRDLVAAQRRPGAALGSLAGRPVDRLADQVGVAVVAGVLLDHVQDHPAQAERPSRAGLRMTDMVQAVGGERQVDDRRTRRRPRRRGRAAPPGESSGAVRHSQSRSASQSTPCERLGVVVAEQLTPNQPSSTSARCLTSPPRVIVDGRKRLRQLSWLRPASSSAGCRGGSRGRRAGCRPRRC